MNWQDSNTPSGGNVGWYAVQVDYLHEPLLLRWEPDALGVNGWDRNGSHVLRYFGPLPEPPRRPLEPALDPAVSGEEK